MAPTADWLVGAGIAQGVGAALLQPASLAILTAAFPKPSERARAIGIWAGVSGLALGMGPVVGGALVEHVGWQSVFLINVPIGLLGLVVAWRHVVESADRRGRRLDVPGQLLAVLTLGVATFALIESNDLGWGSPTILSLFAVAAAGTAAFIWVESRSAAPMLDLRFFRNPAFAGANLIGFAVGLGMFAISFFLSLNLQQTYGYSAFEAGLRILPVTAAIVLAPPIAGRLAATRGPRYPLVVGLVLAAIAQVLLLVLDVNSSYVSYVWILPLSGLGVGLTMTPMTAAVMNAVPAERAGMASATTSTAREVGGNFGIAFIGALLVAKFTDSLNHKLSAAGVPAAARDAVITSATTTGETSHGTGPSTPMERLNPAAVPQMVNESFINGLHLALIVAATFLIVAAVVAATTIPGRRVGHDRTEAQGSDSQRTPWELSSIPA